MRALAVSPIIATLFAGHDGRSERVFRAAVRGVNGVGLEEERKDGGKLDGQIGGKLLGQAPGSRSGEDRLELMLQMATGDREAMRADLAGPIAIPDAQSVWRIRSTRGGEVVLAIRVRPAAM